ncbi:MAG: fused MFS/spermidine synthase [Candidatus Aureabacteria bacterium]|nr:fused MFS/spermidine synthase [Candidatus Auribacterota bacterium]
MHARRQKIWAFHTASFLSAFLLFQLQPMAAKAILPLFGGSHLVWAACMLFFQGVLLGGYIAAHSLQKTLGAARYGRFHWIALIIPFLQFPFHFQSPVPVAEGWFAFVNVLKLLAFIIGLPFFTLSMTSLILQRWLALSPFPERQNPYVLYSASNLGSLLGLMTYPVIFEPVFNLEKQGKIWWALYACLIVLHLICFPYHAGQRHAEPAVKEKIPVQFMLSWLLLSAAACAMLLATTNIITIDVASVPFLWVFPLSLYLLTFVLTFKKRPWLPKHLTSLSYWSMTAGIILYLMTRLEPEFSAFLTILLYLAVLFFVCLMCHGILIKTKPENTNFLTTFYVCISAGGWLGTLIVAWLIPAVSSSPVEYPAAFIMASLAFGASAFLSGRPLKKITIFSLLTSVKKSAFSKGALVFILWIVASAVFLILIPTLFQTAWTGHQKIILFGLALPLALILKRLSSNPWAFSLGIAVVLFCLPFTQNSLKGKSHKVKNLRNFYGIYRIFDKGGVRYLQHGTVEHGRQYLSGPKAGLPISYYHPSTPVGEIFSKKIFHFQKAGMVGLGTGALAAYFDEGQRLRIYELDPDNIALAEAYFTYLRLARQRGVVIDFVTGDGRISLQKEPDQAYDLLILDAFSSDAIPVHLLTVEAFQEYFRVLQPDGLLLVHISNKMLVLHPVVFSIAQECEIPVAIKATPDDVIEDANSCIWTALTRDQGKMKILYEKMGWKLKKSGRVSLPAPWRDQYSHLFGALAR